MVNRIHASKLTIPDIFESGRHILVPLALTYGQRLVAIAFASASVLSNLILYECLLDLVLLKLCLRLGLRQKLSLRGPITILDVWLEELLTVTRYAI